MTSEDFKEIMKKRSDRSFEERTADIIALGQVAKFFYMLGQRNPNVPFREKQKTHEYTDVYNYFFPLDIVKDIPEYWEKHYSGDDADITNIKETLAKRLKTGKHDRL